MIKLFGWESKMSKRIEEKREAELAASWKYKVVRMSLFELLLAGSLFPDSQVLSSLNNASK